MRGYKHRNIVCFKGVALDEKLMIVMEFVKGNFAISNAAMGHVVGGALDSYLKRNLGKVPPASKATMVLMVHGRRYLWWSSVSTRPADCSTCTRRGASIGILRLGTASLMRKSDW